MSLLRPVAMTKVGLLGLREDRERILTALHDLRVAQVEPLAPEALRETVPERGTALQQTIGDEVLRFRGLLAALPKVVTGPPRAFGSVEEVLAAARAVPIDAEVGELKREDDRLLTEERAIDETLRLLGRMGFYRDRLELLRATHFLTFFGEAKTEAYRALRSAIPSTTDATFLEAPGATDVRFLVVLAPSGAEALGRVAQTQGIRLLAVPALDATVPEETARQNARRAEVVRRRAEIASRLTTISVEWYATVAAIDEALSVENRKIEVLTKLGAGKASFALEAWVPQRDLARLETVLRGVAGRRVYLYPIPTHEEPPTLMENPPGIRRFEFFIRFYSLPQATEWDPTLVFAIVFPIFFGMMLADWGYGLTILLICLWMIRGFPGARYLPRMGRNFVKLIMGPKGMQQLAYALLPGCALAIGLGVLFDEFFGVHVLHTLFGVSLLPDPLHQVGPLLLIAGYLGLGMVTLGFLLGGLKEYFHHHRRGALGKLGGILFAWGIAGYGLQVIHNKSIFPYSPILALALAGLASGAGLLVLGEGSLGLLSTIDIISHILSYTRLVGILLASVVLAVVINDIASLIRVVVGSAAPGIGPVIGILLAAVIIAGGQAFNVILGVFEPGIQGARLIFVEHFSKYFGGNGRPFSPFGAERRHTVSTVAPAGDSGATAAPAAAR
jgi:V/A-type H+/Na+-transporting ATPase subunit I